MSRRAANFVQADVARVLRAVRAAGDAWRVDILPGGIISITPATASTPALATVDAPDDDGADIVL